MTRSIACVAFLLSGCMSLSEPECRDTDWFKRGESDALNYGMRPQIDQYANLCSRYGVRVPEATYMTGWLDGYREWVRRTSVDGVE